MKRMTLAVYLQIFLFLGASLAAPPGIRAQEEQGGKPGTAAVSSEVQAKGAITLPQTGQTKTYGPDDDATLRKGAAWPSPRFIDNNNETITDNLTGLIWTRDARNPGPPQCPMGKSPEWKEALAHVACLNANKYLGHEDWRMPNVNELESLINPDNANSIVWLTAQGFRNVMMEFYWSSTTDAQRPKLAWVVVMYSGNVFSREKTSGKKFPVWPVRGTSAGAIALPRTGQTTCYGTDISGDFVSRACKGSGQDGELGMGIAWPEPRFSVAGECVTDSLTGLTWVKNPQAKDMKWTEALTAANDLSLCGYTDWRLPNRNELRSLVNYGEEVSAKWLNKQGFEDIKPDDYWSSTVYEDRPGNAWVVNLKYGHVVAGRKDKSYLVLPVRGGQ